MIFRNSLKHVFRTPVRTSLFIILLTAITAFLTIGIGMHLGAGQSIKQADEAFTTIGVIAFADLNNADLTLPDIMDYDYSPIVKSKHVKLLDRRIMLAGVSDSITTGTENRDGCTRIGVLYSVIEFTPLKQSVAGEPTLIRLLKVQHSNTHPFQAGAVIQLVQWTRAGEAEYQLEPGKNYVACGIELPELSRFHLHPNLSYDFGSSGEDGSLVPIMEIGAEDYLESEDGVLWNRLLELLKRSVQTLSVYTTDDLDTMLIFHQGNAVISSGRTFSQTDYEEGAKVCIINAATAKNNGFQVGDRISLALSEEPLIFSGAGVQVDDGSADNSSGEIYEIIGFYTIINNMGESYGLYEDTVFVPRKSVPFHPDNITTAGRDNIYSETVTSTDDEFILGTSPDLIVIEINYPDWGNFVSFRLANGSVEAFKKEMAQSDFTGLNITYYDQGYSKISGALGGMRETASLLTAVCSAAGLGIALLFALLFVGRQQRSIAIMYSLGAGRKKALAFLMLTVLMVAGLAVGFGSIAGVVLSDYVLERTYAQNFEAMAADSSYSVISGEDFGAGFQVVVPPSHQAPLVAAGMVLAATLTICGLFAARVLRAEPMQVLTAKEE